MNGLNGDIGGAEGESAGQKTPTLIRGVGLLQATAANMLNMIGVGPFITIPLFLATMGGPQAMIGWVLGAVIAISDGMVWAELGAAMPGSGGPYRYLQEAYGPKRWGRLMSFLFIWQAVIITPISIASGAVGLAMYAKYFWSTMTDLQGKLLAAGICLIVTALLYRDIKSVGRFTVVLWAVVMLTVAWVVVAGLMNFQTSLIFDFPPGAFDLNLAFFAGLSGATLIAMYDYGGYFNVCLFGGEVRDPARTIPRSIMIAVLIVAALYLIMSTTIIGVVPWRDAMKSSAVVSDFIERLYGTGAAKVMTALILWTSFASVFAIMLGNSRVPYAAAAEGRFFKPFARLHPTKRFPSFSVVTIGILSAACCFFTLSTLLSALIVIQIMTQFIAQVLAVPMIRRFRPDIVRPFKMWAYPLPVLLALGGWLYILSASGWVYIAAGLGLMVLGIGAYLLHARRYAEWPFADSTRDGGEGAFAG